MRADGPTELELAGQVIELVRRLGGPAAQAEAVVTRADLALTRFANSAIHQNVAESTVGIRLRVHVDGRTAAGSGSVVTANGLRALVERTLAAARLCPPDPGWPGLAPPTPAPLAPPVDEATAHAEPDQRADRVRAFVAAAGGLSTAGYCRTAHRSSAYANSTGHTAQGRSVEAAMDGIARQGGADGVARHCADRLSDIDGAELGGRAAAKAQAAADPIELPPGHYEVVFEPAAVADLLQNLSWYGFNGKRYAERQSFAEPGADQFDRTVTLVDDPLSASGLPFDAEGTGRRALTLVEGGTTRAVAHDRRTAVEAGAESTGHAVAGGATWGPMARNLRLSGAAAGPASPVGRSTTGAAAGAVVDSDTAALVAGVRRGLLVTDLWYTRVLDPKSLVVTGLTRNGVWLVEDGTVTRAVRDLRFTESYPQALGPGAVLGLGARPVRQPDRVDGAWWAAPPVRLASWHFTGGASG
ncbi:Predicted Zn-dependent protease or its inactivated homolog [Micromonospora coriariae]|uniref:Predicted Zn-dependent protease or its inactivated homolog n=1 Tax=Micromonospora coriariae TaxID=285665 RepID=A0A1C4WCG6_9ACTN|nr:metallopeptidase TldD-related protein [Micromonospora coriariae]SCE93937.1 Predicted Zn-dependent protease or its inactivated homolog [Micromonospora coriariae]